MPAQELVLKQEKVSKKPYTSLVLLKYIAVDGQLIKACDATDEEFYCYVYGLLERFYEEEMKEEEELKEEEKIVERRYRESFDWDWSDEANRVAMINEFNRMNRARRTCKLTLIALFV